MRSLTTRARLCSSCARPASNPQSQESLSPTAESSAPGYERPSFRQEGAHRLCLRLCWFAGVSCIDHSPGVRDSSPSSPFPGFTRSRTADYLRCPSCHWRCRRARVSEPGAELWVQRGPSVSKPVSDELVANALKLHEAWRISTNGFNDARSIAGASSLLGLRAGALLPGIVGPSPIQRLGVRPRRPRVGAVAAGAESRLWTVAPT
jgi:hypothetical protein